MVIIILLCYVGNDLKECINVSNSWYILWYEWFQLCLQVNGLGGVPRDVLEQLLQFTAHLEVLKLSRVIHSGEKKKKLCSACTCTQLDVDKMGAPLPLSLPLSHSHTHTPHLYPDSVA